jgi:hypothetical protein
MKLNVFVLVTNFIYKIKSPIYKIQSKYCYISNETNALTKFEPLEKLAQQ